MYRQQVIEHGHEGRINFEADEIDFKAIRHGRYEYGEQLA